MVEWTGKDSEGCDSGLIVEIFQNVPRGSQENGEKLEDNLFPCWESNRALSEYMLCCYTAKFS
jgi:hypothetical protein